MKIMGTWRAGFPPKPGVYRLWCQRSGNYEDPENNVWFSYWDGMQWCMSSSTPEAADSYKNKGADHRYLDLKWRWLDESSAPTGRSFPDGMYEFTSLDEHYFARVENGECYSFAKTAELAATKKTTWNKASSILVGFPDFRLCLSTIQNLVPGYYEVWFKKEKRVVVYSLGNGKCTGYNSSIENARRNKSRHYAYDLPGALFTEPKLLLAEGLEEEPKADVAPTPRKDSLLPPQAGIYQVTCPEHGGTNTLFAYWNNRFWCGPWSDKQYATDNGQPTTWHVTSWQECKYEPNKIVAPKRDDKIKEATSAPRRNVPARRRTLLLS